MERVNGIPSTHPPSADSLRVNFSSFHPSHSKSAVSAEAEPSYLYGAGERNRTVVTRLETWGNSHYTTPAMSN